MPRINKLVILENYRKHMNPGVFYFHVGSDIPEDCSKLEQDGKRVTLIRFNI